MAEAPVQHELIGDDPDRELVHAARAGDYQAFEKLVGRYERPLYSLAMRITHSPHDAEEVVQETFLSVVKHLKSFREGAKFFSWLVTIATNHALKVLRRRKSRRTVSLDGRDEDGSATGPLPRPEFIAQWQDDPEKLAERGEVRQLLEEALAELNEKYRLVFILRDVQGLSIRETAEALEISEPNVKIRLLRARLQLREKLTRAVGDETTRVQPHRHDDEGRHVDQVN